jgi:hypothetical protein
MEFKDFKDVKARFDKSKLGDTGEIFTTLISGSQINSLDEVLKRRKAFDKNYKGTRKSMLLEVFDDYFKKLDDQEKKRKDHEEDKRTNYYL